MMALFDFLKRKKEVQKAKEKKPSFAKATEGQGKKPEKKADKSLAKPEIKSATSDVAQSIVAQSRSKKRNGKSFSYDVIKDPHISEKATYLAEDNKYVFNVYERANKPEIKKSVEGIYGVDVLSVNIIKIPHKKRRIGRTEGFKKGYIKAIVTVKEGQKIEVF